MASSILHYDLEELDRFIPVFEQLVEGDRPMDGSFTLLMQWIIQWREQVAKGEIKVNLEDPVERAESIREWVHAMNDLQPNQDAREAMDLWLQAVDDANVPVELAEDVMGRFLWDGILRQVDLLNRSDVPFMDRVLNIPNVPDVARRDRVVLVKDMLPEEGNIKLDEVYTTGIADLDLVVRPVRTNFMVWASRPGVGKSTFMLKMAITNAMRGVKCFYVSLEMSESQMLRRVCNFASGQNVKEMFTDHRGEVDQMGYAREIKRIMSLDKFKPLGENLGMYVGRKTEASAVLNMIEREVRNGKYKIVFVDYLGLLKYATLDEWASLRKLTGDLKGLAMRMNVLMVSASQVNRVSAERGLRLEDMYGSSMIESDADIIIGLESSGGGNGNIITNAINIETLKNRDDAKISAKKYVDYGSGLVYDAPG